VAPNGEGKRLRNLQIVGASVRVVDHPLADQGGDTRLILGLLGHRNIQHTVRYTATNPARFEKLWC